MFIDKIKIYTKAGNGGNGVPKEFQTAEFNLEKGYLDRIVERKDLKNVLTKLLQLHRY